MTCCTRRGTLAVLDPAARRRFGSKGGDAELAMQRVELRAIAWFYAAALHLGLDPSPVFQLTMTGERDGYL